MARLVSSLPPRDIDNRRWVALGRDAALLVQERGEALYLAGWSALSLFGLHAVVPSRRPDCMGLAWLMNRRTIVSIDACRVVMTSKDGSILSLFRPSNAAVEAVLAWTLGTSFGGFYDS